MRKSDDQQLSEDELLAGYRESAKRALPRAVVDADFVLIGCEPARWRLEEVFMESISDGSG